MQDFWFYVQLGLDHVLDVNAYDHILFLAALTLPFSFITWKKVLLLATIFTVAHCLSLALSSYGLLTVDVGLIEFLIPVTILITAVFNLLYIKSNLSDKSIWVHILATAFFGLIHGFGFSNYFKMLMAEEENKLVPLLGFALGIEISQSIIVIFILILSFVLISFAKLKYSTFVLVFSISIILLTVPILLETFP